MADKIVLLRVTAELLREEGSDVQADSCYWFRVDIVRDDDTRATLFGPSKTLAEIHELAEALYSVLSKNSDAERAVLTELKSRIRILEERVRPAERPDRKLVLATVISAAATTGMLFAEVYKIRAGATQTTTPRPDLSVASKDRTDTDARGLWWRVTTAVILPSQWRVTVLLKNATGRQLRFEQRYHRVDNNDRYGSSGRATEIHYFRRPITLGIGQETTDVFEVASPLLFRRRFLWIKYLPMGPHAPRYPDFTIPPMELPTSGSSTRAGSAEPEPELGGGGDGGAGGGSGSSGGDPGDPGW